MPSIKSILITVAITVVALFVYDFVSSKLGFYEEDPIQ